MGPGTRMAGRFTVERHVGAGGMGSVYFARDDDAGGRPVALKVLPEGESSAIDVDRFDREATTLAKVDHPGIVGYVAHGVEAGQPWLAMEWIEGVTLAKRLADPISWDDAI